MEQIERENALFVRLDMSNLTTVGTFALSPGWFTTATTSFDEWIACRASECSLLLFACETSFFVAVETAQFGLETGEWERWISKTRLTKGKEKRELDRLTVSCCEHRFRDRLLAGGNRVCRVLLLAQIFFFWAARADISKHTWWSELLADGDVACSVA